MSMARKVGLLVGLIGVAATVATTAEAGNRKRYRDSPVYIVEQPVVVRQSPVYVVPPPRVIYAPAPVYYEPRYPRYDRYEQYDRYPSSPSLNINIPLR